MSEFAIETDVPAADRSPARRVASQNQSSRRFDMNRLVPFWVCLLSIAIGAWIASASPSLAAGPLETSGNFRWIVFASRQNVDEAIGLARRLWLGFRSADCPFDDERLVRGRRRPDRRSGPRQPSRRSFRMPGGPRRTPFSSKGQTFIEKVWESPKSPVLASASSAENDPHVASAAGLEVRVEPPAVIKSFASAAGAGRCVRGFR